MSPRYIKILSSMLLLALSAAFGLEQASGGVLPGWHQISPYDASAWSVLLFASAFGQLVFLYCADCLKCRIWGDFILQAGGLLLIVLSGAFMARYPPLTWPMGALPVAGLLFLFAGRIYGRESRRKLEERQKND